METISVIIPVYNIEDYIAECIESVLRQSFSNIEIILVDDCSTDRSGRICDEYATNDHRIKVIHHRKNAGLTRVRKTGVMNATGKYIGFVDGDDWIEPDMYKRLYTYLVENNAEIATVASDRNYLWGKSQDVLKDTLPEGLYEVNDIKNGLLLHLFPNNYNHDEQRLNGSLCFKLIERRIISEVINKIDENISGRLDDTVVTTGCVVNADYVYISHDVLYHHRERAGSYTYSKDRRGMMQIALTYDSFKRVFSKSVHYELILQKLEEFLSVDFINAYNEFFDDDRFKLPTYVMSECIFPHGSRVLIYGAGRVGKSFALQIESENKYELVGLIDKDKTKIDLDKKVYGIDDIGNLEYDYILIAVLSEEMASNIRAELLEKGIDNIKIIYDKPRFLTEAFYNVCRRPQ
ncbi:MAG: glycosyltransferase [Lachnospiraceae bacterium]|nr:glycosyltransferase [Lachnospiraceae bacterium]